MARPPSLRIYVPDAPPAGTDPVLAAWLTGELYRISQIAALGADTGDEQDDAIGGHTHDGTDSAVRSLPSHALTQLLCNLHAKLSP